MRAVEFTDWREGSYPLDAVTEALDYLRTHQTEFETLLQLPGIEGHYLNIVAAVGPGTSAEAFELDAEDIALLASMGFAVSIAVQRTEKDRE